MFSHRLDVLCAFILVVCCGTLASAAELVAPTDAAPAQFVPKRGAGPAHGAHYTHRYIPVPAGAAAQTSLAAPRAAGLTIVPTFDASITGDPRAADIMATINALLAQYQANFSDAVTVAITFKQDTSISLGESLTYLSNQTYTDFRTALAARSTSADDTAALATMPVQANNPVTNTPDMVLSLPLARLLGLDNSAPPGGSDSTISLNIPLTNILNTDNDAGKFSLASTVAHEVDEVLGMSSRLAVGKPLPTAISPVDLFRYDANGARNFDLATSAVAFCCLDGKTQLVRYNQDGSGDYGDWYSPGGQTPQVQDANGTAGAHEVLGIELRVLDAIGYTRTANGAAVPNLTLNQQVGIAGPPEVMTGQRMSISSSVMDNGTGAAGSFKVRFTLSTDSNSSEDDVELGELTVPSVGAGNSASVTWTGDCPALKQGNYFIIMDIDPENTVGESNTEDNIFFRKTELAVLLNHAPVITSAANYIPPATVNAATAFTVGASDPDNAPLTISWDFGDGTSDTGASVSHAYTQAGKYAATATVTDNAGGSVSSSVTVTVSDPVKAATNMIQKFTLNFVSRKDALDIKTAVTGLPTPADGDSIAFVIGDVQGGNGVTIDEGTIFRGKAKGALGSFKFSGGAVEFKAANVFLQTILAPYGAKLKNPSASVTVPMFFQINDAYYGGSFTFHYAVKNGKGTGN